MTGQTEQRSEYETWAEAELRRAGLYSPGSDYDGMLGPAVMKMVEAHAGEGHSGFSAMYTAHLFQLLAERKALTPLTDDPTEWMHIAEDVAGEGNLWQSRRQSSCFSHDGGETYWDIDSKPTRRGRLKRRLGMLHDSAELYPIERSARHADTAPFPGGEDA